MNKLAVLVMMILTSLILMITPVKAASDSELSERNVTAVREEEENPEETEGQKTFEGVPPGINHEIVFYKDGFFGYGEEGDFKQWSFAHILPMVFTLAVIFALSKYRNQIRNWKYEEEFRFCYAFMIMMFELGFYWRLNYIGPADPNTHTMMMRLPLQVCGWTLTTCAFMMMKKSKYLFSMDFFLTMSFGILPLFFPAVISTTGPRYWRYYHFWAEHLMPIMGVYYMMFVHGMEPKPIGMALGIGMIALMVPPSLYFNNRFEDCYYLYLKPDKFAMISFLPKSVPLLMAIGLVVILVLFLLTYFIYRKASRRKPAEAK